MCFFEKHTLSETNSSPLKIGLPKRKGSYSNHPILGVMLASGRVYIYKWLDIEGLCVLLCNFAGLFHRCNSLTVVFAASLGCFTGWGIEGL